MSLTIKGTIMWAALEVVNEESGKYQVDLCNLSDKAIDALEALELTVHYKDDQPDKGHYITCKSQRPIRAYDTDGSIIDGRVVGNGSEFVAKITTYSWVYKKKAGVSPNVGRLTITALELYEGEDSAPIDMDEAL